jgi:hypothetical protein
MWPTQITLLIWVITCGLAILDLTKFTISIAYRFRKIIASAALHQINAVKSGTWVHTPRSGFSINPDTSLHICAFSLVGSAFMEALMEDSCIFDWPLCQTRLSILFETIYQLFSLTNPQTINTSQSMIPLCLS